MAESPVKFRLVGMIKDISLPWIIVYEFLQETKCSEFSKAFFHFLDVLMPVISVKKSMHQFMKINIPQYCKIWEPVKTGNYLFLRRILDVVDVEDDFPLIILAQDTHSLNLLYDIPVPVLFSLWKQAALDKQIKVCFPLFG